MEIQIKSIPRFAKFLLIHNILSGNININGSKNWINYSLLFSAQHDNQA